MIAWEWLVLAVFVGAVAGVMAMGLAGAATRTDEEDEVRARLEPLERLGEQFREREQQAQRLRRVR